MNNSHCNYENTDIQLVKQANNTMHPSRSDPEINLLFSYHRFLTAIKCNNIMCLLSWRHYIYRRIVTSCALCCLVSVWAFETIIGTFSYIFHPRLVSRSWGWGEQWSSQDVDGVDTRHHLATICTLPSPSYLSYLWHGTIMYLTHTHIVTTQNISYNIVRGPVLVLAKKIACSEIPDFNCIKSFVIYESWVIHLEVMVICKEHRIFGTPCI